MKRGDDFLDLTQAYREPRTLEEMEEALDILEEGLKAFQAPPKKRFVHLKERLKYEGKMYSGDR
jgi:hypothetical protein